MPLFEYECTGCGNKFEILVRGAEKPPCCPKCGSADVDKCLSVFAVSTRSSAPAPGGCASCPHANNPAGCASAH